MSACSKGGSFRRFHHLARYHWLHREWPKHAKEGAPIIELGCFDAKTVEFIPQKIDHYVGLDANWEGGLDIGRARYADRPKIELRFANHPSAFSQFADKSFDAALETLERIEPSLLPGFLAEIARVTDGPFYVSVRNEMGPAFLAKYVAKTLRYGAAPEYRRKEVLAAFLRQAHKVERDEHKGFDFRHLMEQLGEWFDVTSVRGLPRTGLPAGASLTIGIVAMPKKAGVAQNR